MAAVFSAFAIWASFPCVVTPGGVRRACTKRAPAQGARGSDGHADVPFSLDRPALVARIVRNLRESWWPRLQPAVIGRGQDYGLGSARPNRGGPPRRVRPGILAFGVART